MEMLKFNSVLINNFINQQLLYHFMLFILHFYSILPFLEFAVLVLLVYVA
jgi:hypothetical protein